MIGAATASTASLPVGPSAAGIANGRNASTGSTRAAVSATRATGSSLRRASAMTTANGTATTVNSTGSGSTGWVNADTAIPERTRMSAAPARTSDQQPSGSPTVF